MIKSATSMSLSVTGMVGRVFRISARYLPRRDALLSKMENAAVSFSRRMPRPNHCLSLISISGMMMSLRYKSKSSYRFLWYSMTGSGTGNGSFTTIRLESISPARSIPSPALSLANSTPFPLLRKLLITSNLPLPMRNSG